jgi:hypothetical protein
MSLVSLPFMDGPGAFTPGFFVLERLNGFDVYQESPE